MEIKETKEVLEALKSLGVLGARIFSDGKISLSDIKYLKGLGETISSVKNAVENIDLVDDEIKDLSIAEAKELLELIFNIIKEIKEAKYYVE